MHANNQHEKYKKKTEKNAYLTSNEIIKHLTNNLNHVSGGGFLRYI